jgi:hypothetical protein
MAPANRRVLTTALGLLALFALTRPAPLRAQNVLVAADAYAQRVLLGANEVSGYRLVEATAVSAAGTDALAIRYVSFVADPPEVTKALGFTVYVFVYAAVDPAHRQITNIRNSGTEITGDGSRIAYRWDGSVGGADEAESFRFTVRSVDGRSLSGSGVGWRRQNVAFVLFAYSAPGHEVKQEALRLASLQNSKVTLVGTFTLPTPGQHAGPGATEESEFGEPAMLLLVAPRIGGAIVRDGTVVRAYIGGQVCGEGATIFGWTFLAVESRDTKPGCGAPGATVTFTIDGIPANETETWVVGSFARGLMLTSSSDQPSSGVLVRPVVSVRCRPAPGQAACSDIDERLWNGDLETWLAVFAKRGEEPSGGALLRAWARMRAERGEVLGGMVLAVLEGQPYTFINAVRYQPSDEFPDVYIEIANLGGDRPVGNWEVRTADDGVYIFPPDTVLGTGACRIYLSEEAAARGASACPGAVLSGGTLTPPGAVYLINDQGEIVDSVGF